MRQARIEIDARSAKPAARPGTTARSRLGGSRAVVVSALGEPAQRKEQRAGRAAERPQGAVASAGFRGVTRPACFPTTIPAHARRGRRRLVAATTCSRSDARSPSSCWLESRRGGWRSSRTAAGAVASADFCGVTRPARCPTTRSAHVRRCRRRSVAATACSRRGARSLSLWRLKRAGAVAGGGAVCAGVPHGRLRRGGMRWRTPGRTRSAHDRRGRRRAIGKATCSRRRALAVVELARSSRRGDWRSGSTGVVASAECGCEVMMTRAPSDRAIGGRTARSAASDLKDDALAALRALAFVELARRSRRGGWRSGSTGVMTPVESGVAVTMTHADCRRRERRTHDEAGGSRSEGRCARGAARARPRQAGSEEPAR